MDPDTHSSKLALVTGITGYLGSHLCLQLLNRGYRVRGTVRNKSDSAKLAVTKGFPHQERLEIVEADLLNAPSLHAAVKGCQLVFHVASPNPTVEPKDENVLIRPAVEGTLEILKACAENHEVEHVIITSSTATVYSVEKKETYNEDDWTDSKIGGAYVKSKVLAEKAAWDFYSKMKAETTKHRFRMTVIIPGGILGPTLGDTNFHSGSLVKQMLTGEMKFLPNVGLGLADVREVALAHILAVERPEVSNGKRYICAGDEHTWFADVASVLRNEYGKFGYPIPTVVMDKCPVSDPKNFMAINWGRTRKVDNSRIKKDLGIKFAPAKEAILATARSFIELGAVPNLMIAKTK